MNHQLQRHPLILSPSVSSNDFPGHWPGEDMAWDKDNFAAQFQTVFHHNDPQDASFSIIGIDAAVANAFRRILIAEIPILAIEYVFINNNTSIIQDEVRLIRTHVAASYTDLTSLNLGPLCAPRTRTLQGW